MEKEYNLSFIEIFNQDGWYKSESFTDGTHIVIEHGEMSMKYFSSETETFSNDMDLFVTKNLVNKKYKKVLNKGQLFSK